MNTQKLNSLIDRELELMVAAMNQGHKQAAALHLGQFRALQYVRASEQANTAKSVKIASTAVYDERGKMIAASGKIGPAERRAE